MPFWRLAQNDIAKEGLEEQYPGWENGASPSSDEGNDTGTVIDMAGRLDCWWSGEETSTGDEERDTGNSEDLGLEETVEVEPCKVCGTMIEEGITGDLEDEQESGRDEDEGSQEMLPEDYLRRWNGLVWDQRELPEEAGQLDCWWSDEETSTGDEERDAGNASSEWK